MPKGTIIEIAEKTFKNKTEAFNFFADYLRSHESIPENDYPLIEAFMQLHPRGVKNDEKIIITSTMMYGKKTKCFGVVDPDGTVDERSCRTAINGYNKSSEVKWCMRSAVQSQIEEFRSKNTIPQTCPICHSPTKEVHIDHIIPFRKLLADFLAKESLTYDDIEIVREVGQNKHLKDEELAKRFADYHKEHAQLRYLCAHCNLTLKRK